MNKIYRITLFVVKQRATQIHKNLSVCIVCKYVWYYYIMMCVLLTFFKKGCILSNLPFTKSPACFCSPFSEFL